MLKYRLISFFGLLALLGWILTATYGRQVLAALAMPVAGLLVWEVLAMLERIGLPGKKRLGAAVAVIAVGQYFLIWILMRYLSFQTLRSVLWGLDSLLMPVAALVGWGLIVTAKDRLAELKQVLVTAGVLVLTLSFLLPLMRIFQLAPLYILYFILVTKAGDTGGYIVGRLTALRRGGNHKVAPEISPGKSWEGVGGGVVCSVAVSCLFAGMGWVELGWGLAPLLGVVLYCGGFAGDLTESAVKRACGVKDSGAIVPGMGGVFDVLDSFIYNAPMFLILLEWVTLAKG